MKGKGEEGPSPTMRVILCAVDPNAGGREVCGQLAWEDNMAARARLFIKPSGGKGGGGTERRKVVLLPRPFWQVIDTQLVDEL